MDIKKNIPSWVRGIFNGSKLVTTLLDRLGWFGPVASGPEKPYFTRFLRVLTFCLEVSKIVIFCENGVVKRKYLVRMGYNLFF